MTSDYKSTTQASLQHLIEYEKLPTGFQSIVDRYYWPVAQAIAKQASGRAPLHAPLRAPLRAPLYVGLQGSQGSGKSTMVGFLKLLLEQECDQRTLVCSIDDFYLTRKQRLELARSTHPLFATRGVPGTHDLSLLNQTMDQAGFAKTLQVPVFDKALDDRVEADHWRTLEGPIDVMIVEGWCVGLVPQTAEQLLLPINDLERLEDPEGIWRRRVNEALQGAYRQLFDRFDYQITLQAPSFDCVYHWRLLQEEKLIMRCKQQNKSLQHTLNKEQIKRFVSHYQRLTEHALLTMPGSSDCLIKLADDHSFCDLRFSQDRSSK